MGQGAQLQTLSLKTQKLGELFLSGEWERCHCHIKRQGRNAVFGGIRSPTLPSELSKKNSPFLLSQRATQEADSGRDLNWIFLFKFQFFIIKMMLIYNQTLITFWRMLTSTESLQTDGLWSGLLSKQEEEKWSYRGRGLGNKKWWKGPQEEEILFWNDLIRRE